ncbi:MAG: hypothetical protein HOP09_00655 [Hyphomicrobium sp.]|nr:hypothetical protein [Hyphomicrobium sp.]
MPSYVRTFRSTTLACLSAFAAASGAFAADEIVKVAPTPMPAAGPTVAAAQQFCGEPTAKADELIARYSTAKGLSETYKSVDYVAYSDDAKNPTVVYTFTTKGHPAHPAAVCRKQVKEGDALVLKMQVVCDGAKEPCDKLRNDFNVMNAKMQAAVDNQIKDAQGKK